MLRQTGDWDRAVTLCRQVIASSDAPCTPGPWPPALGSILAHRGQTRRARPLLLEPLTLARRIELASVELHATWGWPSSTRPRARRVGGRSLLVDGRALAPDRGSALRDPAAALGDDLLRRVGGRPGARTCAAALAQVAADAGQDEAMSALSHALGETALLDGSAEQAASQFARALVLLQGLDVPFDRPRPNAGPPPHWPVSAGARRPWSTWSWPTAPPAGWAPGPGGTAHRQPHRPGRAA